MKPSIISTVPAQPEIQASNAAADPRKREAAAHALSRFLASTYALYQKSLFYHWNVGGPHFVSLHKLFEEHYQELHEAGDTIAERIRALGYFAPGTLTEFAALSSVAEDRKLPASAKEMIGNLLKSHEVCSGEARKVLTISEEADDQVTFDLMVQRMAFHDKAAWMLRELQA
ncbi:MAG: DNA starvation/stationary phase protection protein [Alphaproteobacteria bacterium]